MSARESYRMSEEQHARLLDACKPVPYMIVGGMAPRSPQENANDAWRALGREMGFDWRTVKPAGADSRDFTAEPLAIRAEVRVALGPDGQS